jgi:hypothetical protein
MTAVLSWDAVTNMDASCEYSAYQIPSSWTGICLMLVIVSAILVMGKIFAVLT